MQNQRILPSGRIRCLLISTFVLVACTEHHPHALTPFTQRRQDAPLLATDNEWGAYDHDLAYDMHGNVLAVWEQYDGVRYGIWANRKMAGQGWAVAQKIASEKTGNAYNPRIAVDSQGNAVAVWQQVDGTHTQIGANRYMVGTGWSTAVRIDAPNAVSAQAPQVRFDLQDNAIAVWQQRQGVRTSMHANRLAMGANWAVATQIAPAQRSAYHPQISIDAQGFAVVQWLQPEGMQRYKAQSRLMAGGDWGSVDLLPDGGATLY